MMKNTRLIAYMVNGLHSEVALIWAFTRGDGGQNLIGKELAMLVWVSISYAGVIESERNDGGRQFFYPCDGLIGYSKRPDRNTSKTWDKEKGIKWRIGWSRKFQPDTSSPEVNTIPGVTQWSSYHFSDIAGRSLWFSRESQSLFQKQLSFIQPCKRNGYFGTLYIFGWGIQNRFKLKFNDDFQQVISIHF